MDSMHDARNLTGPTFSVLSSAKREFWTLFSASTSRSPLYSFLSCTLGATFSKYRTCTCKEQWPSST